MWLVWEHERRERKRFRLAAGGSATGSWREALRRAGFATFKRTWARDEVIAVLQHAARIEGGRPRQTEWMRATTQRPAASTVRNLFGTWQAALHAAGLGPEA
jgi:hypothetical protein